MFAFLSKRIAIPNGVNLRSITWDSGQGFLACGGDDGLLKVLKLEEVKEGVHGVAAATHLTVNQSLDGHTGSVLALTWNPVHRKLTTSDERGLVIVWSQSDALWYEEMINNRSSVTVRHMKWRNNGAEICIIYDDGLVIVGTVDGHRVWSKDLQTPLSKLEWCPEGRFLLFVTAAGDVLVYSHSGTFLGHLPIQYLLQSYTAFTTGKEPSDTVAAYVPAPGTPGNPKVLDVEWFSGATNSVDLATPALAITLDTQQILLLRHIEDNSPVVINTHFDQIIRTKWNHDCTTLVVAGYRWRNKVPGGNPTTSSINATGGRIWELCFYSPFGQYLGHLVIPGNGTVTDITWENDGTRIALTVDGNIFFATVRPAYKWVPFKDTVVFATNQTDKNGHTVLFWDTKSDTKYVKQTEMITHMASSGDYCIFVFHSDKPIDDPLNLPPNYIPSSPLQYHLSGSTYTPPSLQTVHEIQVHDSIGAPLVRKTLPLHPNYVSMSNRYAAFASNTHILLWSYSNEFQKEQYTHKQGLVSATKAWRRQLESETIIEIVKPDPNAVVFMEELEGVKIVPPVTSGFITCVAVTDSVLLVGRENSTITRYSVPDMKEIDVFNVPTTPISISINCDNTRFSFIDKNNVLRLHTLSLSDHNASGLATFNTPLVMTATIQNKSDVLANQAITKTGGNSILLPFERKDVWDVLWSSDSPVVWSYIEKTRLYTLRDTSPEEPLLSSGFFLNFRDLTLKSVLLDDIQNPQKTPNPAQHIVLHNTRALRDTFFLLQNNNSLDDCLSFIKDNAHPRLWRIFANAALEKMQFHFAHIGFTELKDYIGLKLLKRLKKLNDPIRQKAEVQSYLGNYNEAIKIYLDTQRYDMCVDLWTKTGQWDKLLQIIEHNPQSPAPYSTTALNAFQDIINDNRLAPVTYVQIGNEFADHQQWHLAVPFYEKAKAYDLLVEGYYMIEEYDKLYALSKDIPPNDPLLHNISNKLCTVGLAREGADTLVQLQEYTSAIDVCIQHHDWEKAIEIANKHNLPQIDNVLRGYVSRLHDEGKHGTAIELLRKAGRFSESAKYLTRLAHQFTKLRKSPVIVKKIHILAALEAIAAREQVLRAATGDSLSKVSRRPGKTSESIAAQTLKSFLEEDSQLANEALKTMHTLRDVQSDAASQNDPTNQTMRILQDANRISAGHSVRNVLTAGSDFASGDASQTTHVWKGAEAHHYLIQCNKYLFSGDISKAFVTASRLQLYEDTLEPLDIYSTLIIAAFYHRYYKVASQALIRLCRLPTLSPAQREAFETLGFKIFGRVEPVDPPLTSENSIVCPVPACKAQNAIHEPVCTECETVLPICIASTESLVGVPSEKIRRCNVCKHKMLIEKSRQRVSCPLCHSALPSLEQ